MQCSTVQCSAVQCNEVQCSWCVLWPVLCFPGWRDKVSVGGHTAGGKEEQAVLYCTDSLQLTIPYTTGHDCHVMHYEVMYYNVNNCHVM